MRPCRKRKVKMASYWHIIVFSLLGGVMSLGIAILLLSKKSWANKMASYGTPFAAGALLAAVFLDLLKEGVSESSVDSLMLSTLAGIVIFFFAERFLHWFHHHHDDEKNQADANTNLIIVGDILHNALDGVAIAASFLISVPTGIITTIAVAVHEIPQEIGDFGLLLKKGLSRRKVLLVNVFSALATVAFALITFSLGSANQLPLGLLLGISAGFLLYIAMSDIIPTIHEEVPKGKLFDIRPILLVVGAVVVGVVINLAHNYVDAGHDHDQLEATSENQSADEPLKNSADEHDHEHVH